MQTVIASLSRQFTARFEHIPWNTRDIAKSVAVVLGLTVLMLGLASIVVVGFGLADTPGGSVAMLLATLVIEAGFLGTAWRFSVAKYRLPWADLGFQWRFAWADFGAVWAVVFVGLAINVVYVALIRLVGLDFLLPPPLPSVFAEKTPVFALAAFLAAIVAPVAEETFFRGFVFVGLGRRYGFLLGAVVSAVLFALGHAAAGVVVPIFLLGLILAWLYVSSGTILTCVLAHLIYNSLALVEVALGGP